MELGPLVSHTGLERSTILPDTSGQRPEVLDGLGDGLSRIASLQRRSQKALVQQGGETYTAIETHDNCETQRLEMSIRRWDKWS